MIEPRSIGMGHTALLSDPTATGLVGTPAGPVDTTTWLWEAGYNRKFELGDLDNIFLAGARRHRKLSVAFAASQFGNSDLYAEQLLKGSLAYHYRQFSFGWSLSAMQVQIGNGYGTLRSATFGLGLFYAHPRLLVSAVGDNLTRPTLVKNTRPYERKYALAAEFFGQGSYSVTGRILMEGRQKPRYGLGQVIRLSGKSSFFWGIASSPLEYGGGIEISLPFGEFTYATSVHPVLGFSHTVTLSFSPSRTSDKKGNGFD
jgi:hypothetical protein